MIKRESKKDSWSWIGGHRPVGEFISLELSTSNCFVCIFQNRIVDGWGQTKGRGGKKSNSMQFPSVSLLTDLRLRGARVEFIHLRSQSTHLTQSKDKRLERKKKERKKGREKKWERAHYNWRTNGSVDMLSLSCFSCCCCCCCCHFAWWESEWVSECKEMGKREDRPSPFVSLERRWVEDGKLYYSLYAWPLSFSCLSPTGGCC